MRPEHLPTPVADAEVGHLSDALARYPNGLTRKDLARLFGGDRRGRAVVSAAVERGELAIVRADGASGPVYRLARSIEEVTREAANLASYAESLDRRRRGLLAAWQAGGAARRQPPLLSVPEDE